MDIGGRIESGTEIEINENTEIKKYLRDGTLDSRYFSKRRAPY
jgi:hypothetical protein